VRAKQKTATGIEIPVPKRGDFFMNLRKVATADKNSSKGGATKKRDESQNRDRQLTSRRFQPDSRRRAAGES
jgi:hypothetical protein